MAKKADRQLSAIDQTNRILLWGSGVTLVILSLILAGLIYQNQLLEARFNQLTIALEVQQASESVEVSEPEPPLPNEDEML